MSHVDLTHSTGTRDKKVFAMYLLGALGTTYRVIWGYLQIRWDSQMQNMLLVGT